MKRITEIAQQKKRPDRYSIFLDGEFAFGVGEDVIVRLGLRKGMELDEDYVNDVVRAEDQNKANDYALNLLSYRARSVKEIKDKMKSKEYEDDIIENTIEFLNKYSYLDDYQFGLQFAKDRQNLKGAGKNLIKQELYNKGISRDIIDKILEEISDRDEEYERALDLGRRKANTSYRNEEKDAKYRKLSSFLQRRGYSFDVIKKIMEEVL